MMATVLGITAFAAPADGNVVCVSGLKEDGTLEEIGQDDNLADGWNMAAKYAKDRVGMEAKGYVCIVVDIYADWTASNKSFGSGDGFSDGAIIVPENTTMTINLNGHTINRGLTGWEWNGEVIWIQNKAEVIINDGTVTGGNSGNGAGGIHIDKNADVTLNDVHIVGNIADDDHGGGMAIHDNSTLTMNGGSFKDNVIDGKGGLDHDYCGGAIYVYKATANFNQVEFKNNQTFKDINRGVAIYAYYGTVLMDDCTFDGNGVDSGPDIKDYPALSIIHLNKYSALTATKTTFINNGTPYDGFDHHSSVICADDFSNFELVECTFENNTASYLFDTMTAIGNQSGFSVLDSTFTNNQSAVLRGSFLTGMFDTCTFNNNKCPTDGKFAFNIYGDNPLIFRNCSMGDSDYSDMDSVEFQDADGSDHGGSMFTEGSLTMVVAMAALVVSVASLGVAVVSNKKKSSDK